MQFRKSVNTMRAYNHCWLRFTRWCDAAGRDPLPSVSETICLFVAWCIDTELRLDTIRLNLSAITYFHREAGLPSPVDGAVREMVCQAARALQEKPGGKAAITPEQLARISRKLKREGSPLALRNRAVLLLQFACGWRRSEVAGLNLCDVSFTKEGLRLQLWKSKTDQEGRGRVVGVHFGRRVATCPVLALRAWLRIRGRWPGPLFSRVRGSKVHRQPISGDAVNYLLKRSLERIGEDPSGYGGHSPRAGMITASLERGSSEPAIRQRTGHRSLAMISRYYRPARAFSIDPLAGVL